MDEKKSKSQQKREACALQAIGVKLIDWSIARLKLLELPDNLSSAIIAAKSLKSHGAIRRQAQLIGKLMRTEQSSIILANYQKLIDEEQAVSADFHTLELWRTRLMTEGKQALTEFIDQYKHVDAQQLRQLTKKAIAERGSLESHGAYKALFRYLRSCIV